MSYSMCQTVNPEGADLCSNGAQPWLPPVQGVALSSRQATSFKSVSCGRSPRASSASGNSRRSQQGGEKPIVSTAGLLKNENLRAMFVEKTTNKLYRNIEGDGKACNCCR